MNPYQINPYDRLKRQPLEPDMQQYAAPPLPSMQPPQWAPMAEEGGEGGQPLDQSVGSIATGLQDYLKKRRTQTQPSGDLVSTILPGVA